jgi:hypothetical protein
MSVIAPPLSGIDLGFAVAGNTRVKILVAVGDPNVITDNASGDVASAAVGSLFLRTDGSTSTSLYVKTALPNTWTAK